jgi:hypothetical protein
VLRSVCTLLILLFAFAARASPAVSYDLDVRVDTVARRVDGRARIELTNTSARPLDELVLWRYPERFASRSPALNDYNFYWIYPRTFNPGAMRIGGLTVDGHAVTMAIDDHPLAGRGTLVRVRLPRPLPPGARVVLDVAYDVLVPDRYGAFGCFRRACTLAGGFYPMVPALTDGGFDLSAPPMPGRYRVRVTVPRVSDLVVNGELRALERGGTLAFDLGLARAAALIVRDPSLRTYETTHRGVHIVYHSPSLKPVPSPKEHLLPYLPADRPARVLKTVEETLDLFAELGLPMPTHELRLVEGALRVELAQSLPGFVLLSDQVFDIFPLGRFLKFHEFDVVRAVVEQILDERLLDRERLDDLGWSPQVSASFLTDRYTLRSYQREEYAAEILSGAAWIPAIDRVLYAPQIPFASAYFYTLEDPDPLRDSLAQFANLRPRGRLIAAKLRDLLGDAAVEKLVRAQLSGQPVRAAAEALYQGPLDWFFTQWLGPYPAVDYRFGPIRSERTASGWRHRVTVEKRGSDPPIEPVEVRLRDATGKAQLQRWDGHGRSTELVFDTAGPIALLEIDPRGRLYERLPDSNDDLRFDNRRPPRWKFIYNNFGGLIQVFPSFALDLALDFSLSRILDLKNAFRFLIYTGWPSGATQIGASATYGRGFGRKITAASLSSGWSLSLSGSRLNPDFGKQAGFGSVNGTVVGAGTSLSYSDRLFAWEPRQSLGYSGTLSSQLTILDSGVVLSQVTASTGWTQIVPVSDSHGFALSAGVAATFGDIRVLTQLLQLGGAGGLRGYDVASLPGRMRGVVRAEWRHVFVHSLDWNLAHTLYVRGIGGGLFAEGGFISSCTGYDVGTQDLAADVGYTLRVFGDWFGVSQTTLNVDIAVPLVNSTRTCFDGVPHQAVTQPIGFYFAFGPPW